MSKRNRKTELGSVSNNGDNIVSFSSNGSINRTKRDKRNIFVKELKASDSKYCFNEHIKYYSYNKVNGLITQTGNENRVNEIRKSHHTSEISVTKPDGSKYVYGIPAYNTTQLEYAFTNIYPFSTNDCKNGQIGYNPSKLEDFESEDKGIDKYFDKTETPAYAHSYLLTDILSNDYVDLNNDGPSIDDMGNYTHINYIKAQNEYQWRVPCNSGKANFNEGLKSDKYDDRANFVFGKKEIWHVGSIVGRNHKAYFFISERLDGLGVASKNGGVSDEQRSFKLDSILLVSVNETIETLVKTVYFEYNYQLCPQVENNYNVVHNITSNTGKLTLKKIYFKYANSLQWLHK
jgi:hypothetical protein